MSSDHFHQKCFYCKYFGLAIRRRVSVKTVEILALTVTSKISCDHPIGIDHWDYIKHAGLKQFFCIRGLAKKVINKSITHMTGSNFSGVHSRADKDTLNKFRHTFFPSNV